MIEGDRALMTLLLRTTNPRDLFDPLAQLEQLRRSPTLYEPPEKKPTDGKKHQSKKTIHARKRGRIARSSRKGNRGR